MTRKAFVGLVILFGVGGLATGGPIYVPGDFTKIQYAIDAANNGDEVLVADGTWTGEYNRGLDFHGKAITVRSENGAANCIIDCEETDQGFFFHSGEDETSVVEGFTIINGVGYFGGAIECSGSAPTIRDCIFTRNSASYYGGAIECYGASPKITNCLFYENGINYAETYYGGAIDCEDASPVITNCTFSSNEVYHDVYFEGEGGAIFSSWNSSPQVINCIFEKNFSHAIHEYAQTLTSDVTVRNCLFYDNDGAYYDADTDTVFADNQIDSIPDGFAFNNIDGETLFRAGPASVYLGGVLGNLGEELGSFYLSQTDPVVQLQLNDSPALDAGSGSASDIFGSASTHTTRTDNVQDTGTVDIGFHYRNSGDVTPYYLWTAAPDGHGTISPQCDPGDCSYPPFAEVALTATPDAGYRVSEWVNTDDDDSVDPNNIVTMDEHKTVANQVSVMFEPRPERDLTVKIANEGGRVSVFRPDGTYYGEAYYDEVQRQFIDVQLSVYEGQVVRLEAVPDPNHLLKTWHETDDDSSSELINYVTVDSTKTVSAEFVTEFVHLRVLWSPIHKGGVYPRSGDYRVGTRVELTASLNPGYGDHTVFWAGTDDDSSYEPTNTVTMDDNKTVSVQFTFMCRLHLSVTPGSDGWPHGVILDPITGQPATDPCYGETLTSQSYPRYTWVELTAQPEAGYEVVEWIWNENDPCSHQLPSNPNLARIYFSESTLDTLHDKYVSVRFKQISQLPGNICVYAPAPDGEPDWASGPKGCYPTIQAAIDAAVTGIYGPWVIEGDPDATPLPIVDVPEAPGDIVVVADGVYTGPGNRDLNFGGKLITIRSEFGPENCIIDCGGTPSDPHRAFYFSGLENNGAVVDGFTIRGGYAEEFGGAFAIGVISRPVINNCIIQDNHAGIVGGGVYFQGPTEDDITTIEDLAAEADDDATALEDALDFTDPCVPPDIDDVIAALVARSVAIFLQQIVDSIDDEEADRPMLTNCKIQYNNAGQNLMGAGGGIFCTNLSPIIISTEISNNSAGYMGWGEGGGVYCEEASLAEFINCLIVNNSSSRGGGGFQLNGGSDAIIQLCTVANNRGGTNLNDGIVCDEDTTPTISHCIVYHPFGNDLVNCEADEFSLVGQNPMFVTGQLNQFYSNGYYLSHVETEEVDSPAIDLGDGDFLGILQQPPEEEGGYGLPFDLTTWILNRWDFDPTDAGFHYPFWLGPPLKYKLTMYVIGNGKLKYRVGSDPCKIVESGTYAEDDFDPGTTVRLEADPNCGYSRVKYWYITGTDLSFAKLNFLTMYTLNQSIYHSDRIVVVEFEEAYSTYIEVPGEIPYIGIQDALDKARDGDTVVIAPGTYRGTGFTVNKNITITGTEPSNPDIVANTVIDCAGERWGFKLYGDDGVLYGSCEHREPKVVLAGLSIINAHSGRLTAIDGLNPGDPGFNGGSAFGQGVIIHGSHTVVNCVIRDCTVLGSHGGNGADGEVGAVPGAPTGGRGGNAGDAAGAGIYVSSGNPLIKNCIIDGCIAEGGDAGNGGGGAAGSEEEPAWPGGDGGQPGNAYGAGIYYDEGTEPTFIDCTVTNCIAYGGDGGNGGVGGDCPVQQAGTGPGGDGGVPGLAWGGGVYCGPGSDPNFMGLTVSNCQAIGGQGGDGADAGADFGGSGGYGGGTSYDPAQDKPWRYSSNGGGVYCGPDSDAVFINCTFENNSTTGSISGVGGISLPTGGQMQPRINYNIPSFGGGVYCAFPSSAVFSNCVVRGNETTFLNNQYTGYGGGLCFGGIEEPAPEWFDPITMQLVGDDPIESVVELNYCDIDDNASPVGGGIYVTRADFDIADSNMLDNSSYRGGGIYSAQNIADILRCTIHGNIASQDAGAGQIDPCLPGSVDTTLFGAGGGLYLFTTDANVSDCVISQNDAGGTGGGVYLGGNPGGISPQYYAAPELNNCLITDNTAIKEGAGVSCNLAVESTISNCTIVGNLSIGAVSYGGGVCISTDSTAEVVDSIIWGNEGTNGSQLAVRSGDLYYPTPSNLDITYSDVHRPPVVEGVTGLDIVFCIDTTGSMFGDIEAVKESAVEITDLVAAQASDFRIAVVDYRDYPESPYGVPDLDYLYYDDLAFSSDQDEIVAAINAITLGAGSDWEESVYSALMHCIDGESLGGWRPGVEKAIILMADAPPHDPEPYGPGYTLNDVVSAALAGDATSIFTVLVRGDPTAATYFRSLAEGTGGTAFEVAGSGEVVDAIMQAIGLIGIESTHMYIEDECVLNGDVIYNFDPNTFIWVPGTHNIEEDPLFIGDYFLSQRDANQLADSPCVNTGSKSVSAAELDGYTTRTDGVPDGQGSSVNGLGAYRVDMGYHHRRFEPPRYQLITRLISDIGGTIDPNFSTGFYYDWYAQVPLSVTEPPLGYRIRWTDTDDDESTGATNVVTMDSDKVVVAEFERYWYTLTIQVVGPGTVSIDPNGVNDNYPPGSVVYLTAEPDDGYRVRVWTGADTDPLWGTGTAKVTMDGNRTVIVEFEPDISNNLLVPDEYATIEEAVEAASTGDAIILKRRDAAYTISNPDGIDFMGRNITIMSEKPHEPNCVAATVIDCQGSRYVSKRAFHFHMGEGRDSRIWGITIKNGYIAGNVLGEVPGNGALPGYQIDPEADPNAAGTVFSANNGANARGRGYGGAILCENGSSPTIENCVITRCSATGGQGGDGANGYYVFAGMEPPDGQWGGHAGNGYGNGYGGAVACRDGSNPAIINCIVTDNAARGGCGGIGGDGSQKENPDEGNESWGGNGGGASGAGFGGAIYCDGTSSPAVVDCTFRNNVATSGLPGQGGLPGPGSVLDPPADNGATGSTTTFGDTAGGAAYYGLNCDTNFINCTFDKNEAYEVHLIYQSGFGLTGGYGYVETPIYTNGGALYSESFNVVTLDSCEFTNHLAGAVYNGRNCVLDIDNCRFRNNQSRPQVEDYSQYYGGTSGALSYYDIYYDSATAPGGALDVGPDCEVHIEDCEFTSNYSHGDGGAFHSRSSAVVKTCTFGGNKALRNGGAVEAHDLDASMPLTLDFEACSFGGNEAMLGGAVFFQDFDAAFADCYFAGNRAQSGGGLFLVNGIVALAGGYIIDNHATGVVSTSQATDEEAGRGGGVVCVTTIATIENCVISDNISEGTYSYGGGVSFYGGSDIITHEVRNCLITGNRAGVAGGGISCRIFTTPEIANCTFEGNSAGSYGSGVFSDWTSQPQISDSIFAGCDRRAIYEEKIGDDAFVRYSLFHNNPDGDFYDADTGQGYNGADAINSVAGNHENIEGDPLFVIGPIGDHYLDQSSSAAVDAGSDFAVNLGMHIYTTDPDPNNPDTGTVDIGYHYGDITNVPQYQLKVVIPSGHGTVKAGRTINNIRFPWRADNDYGRSGRRLPHGKLVGWDH